MPKCPPGECKSLKCTPQIDPLANKCPRLPTPPLPPPENIGQYAN